jgi:ketosteroid isomerase-like protein
MSSPATTSAAVEAEDRRAAAEAWVEAFIEGWRSPRSADAFADHFDAVIDPEVRLIQPQIPTLVGRQAFRERFARPLFELIPDLRGEVERWATGEDLVYIELTLRGTLGGRPVSWRTCDRISLRDGVAVEREAYMDPLPLLRAVATRPRAWPGFARMQARELLHRIRRRH